MGIFRKIILALGFVAVTGLAFAASDVVAEEPIVPIPQIMPELPPGKVALGARLFADKRLSKNRTVACTSCHDFANGGDDGLARSIGVGGMMGTNAPTVFNSGLNFAQFWDGRSITLEEQVNVALTSPVAMGAKWEDVLKALGEDPAYVAAFGAEYPPGISRAAVENALATFELSLVTPNARFDRYLRGEAAAITAREKEGYAKFKSYGCVACHQGMNVGGNMFQTMGVMGDFFRDRGDSKNKADLGRFNTTKREDDRHVFKVPSLRNVALTAPYFHDGSAKTLPEAVRTMAKYQLGRKIPESDIQLIVEFLGTLNGEIPASVKEHGLLRGGRP